MSTKTPEWIVAAVIAVVATAFLAGCADDPLRPDPSANGERQSPGIYLSLAYAPAHGDTLAVALMLERVEIDKELGSYQGEVGYDAKALEFAGARIPDGILGAVHEAENGRVRFAGISTDGLSDGAVLILEFTPTGGAATSVLASRVLAEFTLAVEEVGALRKATDVAASVTIPAPLLGGSR